MGSANDLTPSPYASDSKSAKRLKEIREKYQEPLPKIVLITSDDLGWLLQQVEAAEKK